MPGHHGRGDAVTQPGAWLRSMVVTRRKRKNTPGVTSDGVVWLVPLREWSSWAPRLPPWIAPPLVTAGARLVFIIGNEDMGPPWS